MPVRSLGLRRWLALAWVGAQLLACTASGPPSTNSSSTTFPTLEQKVAFLEQYVRFRRHYAQLEFRIFYRNGADGCAPSPSEWDLTLAARVPAQELSQWTQDLARQGSRPAEAPGTLPGIDTTGVREWYAEDSKVVGVDPERAIVVYRIWGH